jgi:RNA-directed DNA polymerase
MMGGVPKRSIFTHAKPHVGKDMVATFDVKKFFPNTSATMVGVVLKQLGFDGDAANAVLELVIKDDEVPQGAPTSGFLANLVLEPADRRIDALCRKHNLAFTRYVDDIAISGNTDLTKFHGVIVDAVCSCGYEIAPNKIHYKRRHETQLVTQLCVNQNLRPTKAFIKAVSKTIWECLEVGAEEVASEQGILVNALKNSLTGKVAHIRRSDANIGDKLRKRLFGIDWSTPAKRVCPVRVD